jgi:hypothetical protein
MGTFKMAEPRMSASSLSGKQGAGRQDACALPGASTERTDDGR